MTDEPETIEAEVVEEALHLPAVVAHEAVIARGELTVDEMVTQKDKILELMQRVMTPGIHFGKIPGIPKPTLLKPGAEAINVALRLDPDYESEKIFDGDHLTVVTKCVLYHIPTRLRIASGEGLCSTKETKYAYRKQKRKCPACGAEAIIKGKAEYGGGWVCWKKEGGCGATYKDEDEQITGQEEGTVPNPDLPDTWNTVLKMADKRALVAAVLNGTAASDVFTQDVEDGGGEAATSTSAQPQERRQEGPPPLPVPKSWGEVEKLVKAADNPDEAWALFQAYLRAASYHLFGAIDQEKLSGQQRVTLLQKAAGAVVYLHDHIEYEMGELVFFTQERQAVAWAAILDGHPHLEIPDYVPPEPPDSEIDEEAERLAREALAGE
jgi:hypothetical protein